MPRSLLYSLCRNYPCSAAATGGRGGGGPGLGDVKKASLPPKTAAGVGGRKMCGARQRSPFWRFPHHLFIGEGDAENAPRLGIPAEAGGTERLSDSMAPSVDEANDLFRGSLGLHVWPLKMPSVWVSVCFQLWAWGWLGWLHLRGFMALVGRLDQWLGYRFASADHGTRGAVVVSRKL